MEKVIIVLLSLNAVVGLLVLLVVCMHYRQSKGLRRPELPPDQINSILQSAEKPLSAIEKKYLLLFTQGKTTEEISEIMHVEPSSVYTMKYRIRKKFPAGYILPF